MADTRMQRAVSFGKLVFVVCSIAAATVGAVTAGKALVAMPAKLDAHIAQVNKQIDVLDKMLCIQVADHRRSDWTKCLISPEP